MAAVTADTDALGEVSVLVELDGRLASGQGVSTDTLEASARAYLRALSNALAGVGAPTSRSPAETEAGAAALADRDFTWIDGERLIRFGDGRARRRAGAAGGPRVRGLCAADHAAGGRARRRRWSREPTWCWTCPAGRVPEAAAAVRDGVGGRPLVALGGGRVIDSAKAIAGADGLPVAAIPTTLSGAEMTPFHRMPAGVERVPARAPGARDRDPVADGLPADARPGRERDERARARGRGALHAAGEPGRRDGGAAGGRADRRGPASARSRTARRSRSARCWPATRSGRPASPSTTPSARRSCAWRHAPRADELGDAAALRALHGAARATGDRPARARHSAATWPRWRLAQACRGSASWASTEADLPRIMEGVAQRGDIAANTPGAPSDDEIRAVIERAL